MTYIRNLSSNTNTDESSLESVAQGLLWKLEKEAGAKPTSSNSHEYDIMISYSHSDSQVCHQIYEKLIKDKFRVWIDRENLHGTTMSGMANAIENSTFVLICMSQKYQQSSYCRLEAHYAHEQQCNIIPLKMKVHYKPDGWLGLLVAGKKYVDFAKNQNNINISYEKLKKEISQHCQQKKNQMAANMKEKDQKNNSAITTQPVEEISSSVEHHSTV
ncbi:unnamed protein product [Rotaria sp. Silwood1]|nr:unnamed protein product [Rotaria sp. Silwood1]